MLMLAYGDLPADKLCAIYQSDIIVVKVHVVAHSTSMLILTPALCPLHIIEATVYSTFKEIDGTLTVGSTTIHGIDELPIEHFRYLHISFRPDG